MNIASMPTYLIMSLVAWLDSREDLSMDEIALHDDLKAELDTRPIEVAKGANFE